MKNSLPQSVRIVEVGPRDLENKQCRVCVRHDGSKSDKATEDGTIGPFMKTMMSDIQKAMFEKVRKER